MVRKRRAFSEEFKQQAVRRVRERTAIGVTLTQIGRELGVRPDLLRKWARVAKERAGEAATSEEVVTLAEVRRLRRENETLRQERDFAKNDLARAARPVAPETRSGYCFATERRGRLLIGVERARQKTWSGGGLRTCEW